MKRRIISKLTYYRRQKNEFTDRYIGSNSRVDRDSLVKIKGKVEALQEVLKMINEEKL